MIIEMEKTYLGLNHEGNYQIKTKKPDLVHIDYRFPSHLDTEVD